jgi:hypothetical protein
MALPASLGLCDDVWRMIFAKSRALARWDARVAAFDALLSESLGKWTPCYFATDTPIVEERYIEFACSFKLLELTKLADEEETEVSIYVFDYSTRTYVYTDEDTEFLFGSDEEEEDVPDE